jgi:hypothetical protein
MYRQYISQNSNLYIDFNMSDERHSLESTMHASLQLCVRKLFYSV